MEKRCGQGNNCMHFIPDYDIGFKIVAPRKGEHYDGRKYEIHTLVFLLNGEIEFSYDDFLNRRFIKGDIFFVPQSVEMYGTAIIDAKMLVLTFNNSVDSLCDRCRLHQGSKYITDIDYDFRSLRITDALYGFAELMEEYIKKDIKCRFLHGLKQKELFVIMGAEFSDRDLAELFYPIVGGSDDFKTRIIENYRYGLDVNELAGKFGMSYTPFLRRFKREFNETVQEWMLKQKAKHIKLRLSIPTTTISDIIKTFNFTDASHFVRFCRKYYGCTPTELLNSVRNKKIEI